MTTAAVARLQGLPRKVGANRSINFINEQKSIKTAHSCNIHSK